MPVSFDPFRCRTFIIALVAFGFVAYVGCISQPSRIHQVEVDIEQRSQSVLGQFDQDKNGSISVEEATTFPALQRRFSTFDADNNGEVSAEEFGQRLETIFDSNVGLLSASCVVTRNGRPLAKASVRFVPEPFLADVLPEAAGVTRRDGMALLSLSKDDLPSGAPPTSGLMRAGLYRVEITHPSHEIPEKYNRQTQLGVEVSGEAVRGGPFRFDL